MCQASIKSMKLQNIYPVETIFGPALVTRADLGPTKTPSRRLVGFILELCFQKKFFKKERKDNMSCVLEFLYFVLEEKERE